MARSRSTQKCFQGLREACGDVALPYRTVPRWVKSFWEGRDVVHDNLCIGRSHIKNNTVHILPFLLDADRRWIARELAAEVEVCHEIVLHILHDIWVTANLQCVGYLMKFPRCNYGTAM